MRKSANSRPGDLTTRFADSLEQLGFSTSQQLAIAVSGGGDSVALMRLFTRWAARNGAPNPYVLTVDHGLRSDSAADARQVLDWAEALGLKAVLLEWRGRKPKASIEEHARAARYRLLGEWCIANRVTSLSVGHTLDDVAENFLLRLARGSGVDGLAAMAAVAPLPVRDVASVQLLRPLLEISRAELRDFLREEGVRWLEDPMNGDPALARVRIRQVMPQLAAAGLSPERIVAASRHIARARSALEEATANFLLAHSSVKGCGIVIDGAVLRTLPPELGLRVLAAVLLSVGGHIYRPRFERLERLYRAIQGDFRRQNLAGCNVGPASKALRAYGPATILISPEKPRRVVPQVDRA